MSQALSTAHAQAWNLATTLMVSITVFQAGNGEFGASCRPPNMTAILPPSSTSSAPSNPEGATVTPGGAETRTGFPLPTPIVFGYTL